MSTNNYTPTAYSIYQPLSGIPPFVTVAMRNPGPNDRFPIGKEWINELTNQIYILTSYVRGIPTWTAVINNAPASFTTVQIATPGAVATPLLNFPLANNQSVLMQGMVDGSDAAFANQVGYAFYIAAIRGGGAAVQTGLVPVANMTTPGTTATAVAAVVGNSIVVTVTGVAATVWNWKMNYTYVSLP
jgi:hypothetical protein